MLTEERLILQTRAAVTRLLEGQSIVEVASWPDQVRNQQKVEFLERTVYASHESFEGVLAPSARL